ncbi:hypothetical protein ACFY04_19430 [Streptomyces sp. NPDC001549]|uniref:hypothetical protein n=1 Tax=Streptomyces sp. NPDC001549 TaxID=3364586 RepID=UPI0036CC4EBA
MGLALDDVVEVVAVVVRLTCEGMNADRAVSLTAVLMAGASSVTPEPVRDGLFGRRAAGRGAAPAHIRRAGRR